MMFCFCGRFDSLCFAGRLCEFFTEGSSILLKSVKLTQYNCSKFQIWKKVKNNESC